VVVILPLTDLSAPTVMVPLPVALVFTGGTSLSPDRVTLTVCSFAAVSLFTAASVPAVPSLFSVEAQPAATRNAAPTATASYGLKIRSRVFMVLPPLRFKNYVMFAPLRNYHCTKKHFGISVSKLVYLVHFCSTLNYSSNSRVEKYATGTTTYPRDILAHRLLTIKPDTPS
jgi:hypothetical protein